MHPARLRVQDRSADHYETIASQYDSQRYACRCGQLLSEVEIRIVASLLGESGRILDVGAGTGRFSLAIAGKSSEVVAIDASRGMASESLRKRAGLTPRPAVAIVIGDAASLPFSDGSFDAVVSVKLLNHLVEINAPISEMSRVLKGAGRLILDVPHSLAEAYRKIGIRSPIDSYKDIHHPFPEIAAVMRANSIEMSRRITYSLLPASLVHITLCSHWRSAPTSVLRSVFDTKIGLLSFVEGIKKS